MPQQDIAEFRRYLDSLTKEEREQLLQDLYRDYEGEEGAIASEQDYAERLRDTPDPNMRRVGRFAVAANPLEFLGTGINRYQGSRMVDDINRQRAEMSQARSRGLRGVASGLLGLGGAPVAAPGAAPGAAPMNPYLEALRSQPPLI